MNNYLSILANYICKNIRYAHYAIHVYIDTFFLYL